MVKAEFVSAAVGEVYGESEVVTASFLCMVCKVFDPSVTNTKLHLLVPH